MIEIVELCPAKYIFSGGTDPIKELGDPLLRYESRQDVARDPFLDELNAAVLCGCCTRRLDKQGAGMEVTSCLQQPLAAHNVWEKWWEVNGLFEELDRALKLSSAGRREA